VANLVDISRVHRAAPAGGPRILVNVASMATYVPGPDMAVYPACKAISSNR
jgi:short-subunit dehydrogenase